ncbi:putative endopeptidase Clp [Helianthus anomalus]
MPLSRVALESPAGAARGQADDIQNEANELLRIRDYLFKELAEKTDQPVEQVCYKVLSLKHFKCVYVLLFIIITKFALSKH